MAVQDRVPVAVRNDVASAIQGQARSLRPVLLVIVAPVLIAMASLIAVRIGTGAQIAELTRDPLQLLDAPVHTGILSTIGGLVWSGTAAVCAFAYAIVRRRSVPAPTGRFILAGTLVTVMLMLDDVFMLHDIVFPEHLGIPEVVVYVAYAVVLAAWVGLFRSAIAQTDFLLLALAFAGLGFSVGVDVVDMILPFDLRGLFLIEDSAKSFGIVSWAAYFVRICARQFTRP